MKSCPHCGASLQEEASFCPYCAQAVNERKEIQPPRHMPGRALYSALIVLVATAALTLLTFGVRSRPKVYDNGNAEVIYTSQGTKYQLCIAWADYPFQPAHQRYADGPTDEIYRYPALLYANLADSETYADEEFLELVDHMTAEVTGLDEELQMTCAQPVRDTDYVPNTAAIVYVNYIATAIGEYTAELTISLHMKNGDVIRLHQTQLVEIYATHDYTAEDAPMDTVQDLEALLKHIEETVDQKDQVNIHLPPVTYTEKLVLDGRPVNLTGSRDESGHRTTFTDTVQVDTKSGVVWFFEDIDFVGRGSGTGLSASARVYLTDCRFAGWDTGVLAHTNSWVVAHESTFEDNGVGFHFNAEHGSPSDPRFLDDRFVNNGTAVLLEQVPNGTPLDFSGSQFEGNSQDIDNRCGQKLELEGAVFK